VRVGQGHVLLTGLTAGSVGPGSAAGTALALGNEGVCDHLHFRVPSC